MEMLRGNVLTHGEGEEKPRAVIMPHGSAR